MGPSEPGTDVFLYPGVPGNVARRGFLGWGPRKSGAQSRTSGMSTDLRGKGARALRVKRGAAGPRHAELDVRDDPQRRRDGAVLSWITRQKTRKIRASLYLKQTTEAMFMDWKDQEHASRS